MKKLPVLLVIICCVVLSGFIQSASAILCPDPATCPCIVDFTASPNAGPSPLNVVFEMKPYYPYIESVDFGDDSTFNPDGCAIGLYGDCQAWGMDPFNHIYQNPGSYEVIINGYCPYGNGEYLTRVTQKTITVEGTSNKIIASAESGGGISPSGEVTVSQGNDQTFIITPNQDYIIRDILVDGISPGALSSYTFANVIADHTIAASFAPSPQFIITTSAESGGGISPSGEVTVSQGNDQTFIITPNQDYIIRDILVDGISQGALSSYTFANVIADHTIAASFAPSPQFIITASAESGGSISPNGEVAVSQGNDQTFIITPNQDYTIQDVLVDGESKGAISSFTFTNVIADHTIAASFKGNQLPVATFKSYNIENVGSSETRVEGYHAVGGLLEFDASDSYDPSGGKLTYYWDFGDGSQAITSDPKYQKIYTIPEKFTVALTVKNIFGQASYKFLEDLDLSLEPGDLIIIRSGAPYSQIFDSLNMEYTHIGMYVGKIDGEYRVVESTAGNPPLSSKIGVQETNIKRWSYGYESWVDIVRVNTDLETKEKAVAFARDLALDANRHYYDYFFSRKEVDCNPWSLGCGEYYCSELVWAAYYRASDGVIDLGNFAVLPSRVSVSPDDIRSHWRIDLKSKHHEKYPPKLPKWFGFLAITTECPVDISVTDPSGLSITKQSAQSSDSIYFESDLNNDNDVDDGILISKPIKGDYLITVIPEVDAQPTDTFTLTVTVDGRSRVLVQEVQIKDIPPTPYVYNYQENGQTPVPEFPSVFLPAAMIIGILGTVLFIQSNREH